MKAKTKSKSIKTRLFRMRVKPPFLVRQMPGHFKWYSGCRGLVRHLWSKLESDAMN